MIILLLSFMSVVYAAPKPVNTFLPEAPASYVAPKQVKLQRFVLDEVPESWLSKPGGKLKTNEQIRRAGEKGIQWDWSAGDRLEIDASKHLEKLLIKPYLKEAFGGGIGFHLWIYNEETLPTQKMLITLAANGFHKEIQFGLNYAGWRACAIQFVEMPDGGNAPDGKIVIRPPVGIPNGKFVFDRFEIGRLTAHTMADHQLPYSKNDNHWVNQYWWEQAGEPADAAAPTVAECAAFARMVENVKQKSLGWSLHVDEWISDAERKLITGGDKSNGTVAEATRIRELARERFSALELEIKRPNISVPYRAQATYPNEITWREIEEFVFPMAALDYFFYKDVDSRHRVLMLLDWFKGQGIVAGHSYGSLSHVGYRSRNLAVGLLLCRDLLADTGRLNEWTETLKWISGFAECWSKKERPGGVGDDGTVAMARLICVLLQDDTAAKLRDAKCFFQWFDDVLGVSDGTQGVIKADYSFYHHAMMLAGYWLTNMPQFCKVLMALEDTPYAECTAWANVRQNLLVFNRMYRSKTQPFNLRGRDFDSRSDYRIHDITLAMALHGNPATGEKVDSELVSAWLCNRLNTMDIPQEFKTFRPLETYHQHLNWAGVSTHSIPGAFATVTGVNNNNMNWDVGEARTFCRYNRTGSLFLHRGTLSAEENGYVDVGWDWSRIPGVTGVYLDNESLKEATKGMVGYVIFKASDRLPGPLKACSRPGLVMVNGKDVAFCDPDLMINPGGEITRYNLGDAPASSKREVVLDFVKPLGCLSFETSNALVKTFKLE